MSVRADNRKQVLREEIFFLVSHLCKHNADRPIKTSQRNRKRCSKLGSGHSEISVSFTQMLY